MKKVVSACIEQHLEFTTKREMDEFHEELKQGNKKFRIISAGKRSRKYQMHVIRQYNNNKFPEGGSTDVQ